MYVIILTFSITCPISKLRDHDTGDQINIQMTLSWNQKINQKLLLGCLSLEVGGGEV